MDSLRDEYKKTSTEVEKKETEAKEIMIKNDRIKTLENSYITLLPEYQENSRLYGHYYNLNRLINKQGNNFVQFVLSIYFKKVLNKANQKLMIMTDGLYQFRQPEEGKINITIFDASTGRERDLKTLSGGETFLASLALALGFSEVVEEENGGIRLDTIFIDEGFGSLDSENLDRSLDVLTKLTNNRSVMIISHVEQLKHRIQQQILVNKTNRGSNIDIISNI